MSKVLLHICCGPCATYVNKRLQEKGFKTEGYFYNPNIRPKEEYAKREDTLKKYAEQTGLKVTYEPKLRGSFLETETPASHAAAGWFSLRFPNKPEDCENCYRIRLGKTAECAKELDFDCFTTTLLISPYQKHDLLKGVAEEVSKDLGIEFFYEDFRKGYSESRKMAKELNLYRQKYCGCKPREEELCQG